MNLKRHIKQILREEHVSDLKKPFMRYEKLINKLVYDVFDEGICGLSWDVIKLYHRKGISLRIILHFTNDSVKEFGYEKYGQSKQELKGLIEDYLPKFDGIYIAYDTTKCKDEINESFTGETPDTSFMLNKPAIIDDTIKTQVKKIDLKDDGTIDVNFKNGLSLNFSQKDFSEITFKIPLRFNSKRKSLNEKELNERCWKGYTQKGMKTMFGKRYPNCVKIKKKKSIKESIRNILLQEVNKKYSKPTEKVDKLVYRWLDDYFEGSQIYKHESWKHWSFRFEFCKNGREIADLHVDFDDKSPDWGPRDKRPTSERSFNNAWLYIYPVMINELLTDIPIRKNYLLYLIEEWFEDTKLNEIQQGFNRSDMSLEYVYVSETKKKGEICVPPVSKSEDVTMQEMMDYIKKNTLYSYEDIEKNEEEEPGWVEELYLAKLRGKEQERLNQEDRDNNPEPFNDDY